MIGRHQYGPSTQYSQADIERSIELAEQIDKLEAEFPEKQKEYKALGAETAKAEDKVAYLVKSRAFQHDIEAAQKEHQQALWKQQAVLANHQRQIKLRQDELETLTVRLRTDTHWRWLDELKGLLSIKKIEVTQRNQNAFSGVATNDILSNEPAIQEAREMLVTAIEQLQGLQHSSIPDILKFIEAFETELSRVDLSKLTREDDIPEWRVRERMEKPEPDGPTDNAILVGGDMLILGESASDRLDRKLDKMRKELARQ